MEYRLLRSGSFQDKVFSELICSELLESSFMYFKCGDLLAIFFYFLFKLPNFFLKLVSTPFQFLILLYNFIFFLVVVTHAVEDCLVSVIFNIAFIQFLSYLI